MPVDRSKPLVPFVQFKIGDFDLTPVPPSVLQTFSHTRIMDAGNTFELTVFDRTALELGNRIAEGMYEVSFSYGWSGFSRSPLYTGMINDYEAVFQAGGAVLSIVGTTLAMKAHGQSHTREFLNDNKVEGIRIHKIIEKIAEEEGWILGEIRPTAPVLCQDSLTSETPIQKIFRQEGEPSTKFIKDKLVEYAMSEDTNESGYMLWFEDTRDGTVVNFAPPTYSKRPAREYIFEWNTPGSPVISFTPRFSGVIQAVEGRVGRIRAVTVNDLSNDFFEDVYDQDSNSDREVAGSKIYNATDYNTLISASSGSETEIRARLARLYAQASSMSYTAELQLFGDTELKTYTDLSVIALTRDGIAHHTSGVYMVTQVVDTIEGARFTSTCALIRNSSRTGEVESTGREVTSPDENSGFDREVPSPGTGGGGVR